VQYEDAAKLNWLLGMKTADCLFVWHAHTLLPAAPLKKGVLVPGTTAHINVSHWVKSKHNIHTLIFNNGSSGEVLLAYPNLQNLSVFEEAQGVEAVSRRTSALIRQQSTLMDYQVLFRRTEFDLSPITWHMYATSSVCS